MDDQKQQVAARVKEANNILVTVSANPSVDQLAACIGLTLALNKMGKHATAVFSGAVPSTIEFLQPEKTIEKNTDSLRDFIIALDKSKADKLRYKVEDTVVKIFITPYRTSISQKDLEFSQGDFNVDVVLAIGVHNQAELDQAITSHGRILHDATVVTINTKPGGELGSINWLDPTSSSLSELTVQLVDMLDKNLLDTQIATAMLTGIVAETDRFSNNKTTPRTMTLSAELMTAGANQQLVATKLEEPAPLPPAPAPIATAEHHDEPQPIVGDHEAPPVKKSDDGTLEIVHDPKAEDAARAASEAKEPAEDLPEPEAVASAPEPVAEQPAPDTSPEPAPTPEPQPEPEEPAKLAPQIHIDEHGSLSPLGGEPTALPSISHHDQSLRMATTPPSLGGQLNANDTPESYEPSVDPLTQATLGEGEEPAPPLPDHPSDTPPVGLTVTPPAGAPVATDESAFSMPYEALESEPPAPNAADSSFDGLPLTPRPDETLTEIEQEVQSPHLNQINALAAAQPPAQPEIEPDLVLSGTDAQAPSVTLPAPDPSASFTLPQQPVIPEPAVPMPPADSGFAVPDLQLPPATGATTDDPADTLDSARDAVMDALNASADPNSPLPPVAALNAQPVDLQLGGTPLALDPAPVAASNGNDYGMAPMTTVQPTDGAYSPAPMPVATPSPAWNPAAAPFQPPFTNGPGGDNPALGAAPDMPTPAQPYDPANPGGMPQVQDPNAPPPVPPPMMPPTPPYNQPY